MVTFALLASVAVGALLAATAYCICRVKPVWAKTHRMEGKHRGLGHNCCGISRYPGHLGVYVLHFFSSRTDSRSTKKV
jgi:hypothetical protein